MHGAIGVKASPDGHFPELARQVLLGLPMRLDAHNTDQLDDPTLSPDGQLISVLDAATYLGVSQEAVRAWVRQGRLRGVRLGRRLLLPVSEVKRAADEGL